MPKRKRYEPSLADRLDTWGKKLSQVLKSAKGYERQRQAKRFRENQASDPEKAQKIRVEISVLKTLDLHQAARAHICSTLLKLKSIASSPNLPPTIRPVPKPDIEDEAERVALHNVTSALFNRRQVKELMDEVLVGVCSALGVAMPEKKGKMKRKREERVMDERDDDDDDQGEQRAKRVKTQNQMGRKLLKDDRVDVDGESDEDEGSWQGFGSEQEEGNGEDKEDEGNSMDSEEEEKAISQFDELLGRSSDEEDEANSNAGDEKDGKALLDRGAHDFFSGSSAEDDLTELSEDEVEDEYGNDSKRAPRQRPITMSALNQTLSKPATKPSKFSKLNKPTASTLITGSVLLPGLMNGYICGSESEASDIEIGAPLKKNRRGQQARRRIAELKYKDQAKHLQKGKEKNSRNQVWDPVRGAVGEDDGASRSWRKPRNQLAGGPGNERAVKDRRRAGDEKVDNRQSTRGVDPRVSGAKPQLKTRDDTGALHPSWEAAKKAKEQKLPAFQGKKITFD